MNKITFVKEQRIKTRKLIAHLECKLITLFGFNKLQILKKIAHEKQFIDSPLEKYTIQEILNKIHLLRHGGVLHDCSKCKVNQKILIPRIGNLLDILQRDLNEENARLEHSKLPSQNDLTRWALKNVVMQFYSDKNLPPDTAIMDNPEDDRLTVILAPDFDVIFQMWLDKLDELGRRDDKYRVEIEEYNRAQDDLVNGMRGSAFEKQLDRFRKEFMQKIKDEFYAGSN